MVRFLRRLSLFVGCTSLAFAEDLDQETLKWSAAAEKAAIKVKSGAADLAETAEKVKEDGRIGWLPILRSQADELVRRAELFERLTTEEPPAP